MQVSVVVKSQSRGDESEKVEVVMGNRTVSDLVLVTVSGVVFWPPS